MSRVAQSTMRPPQLLIRFFTQRLTPLLTRLPTPFLIPPLVALLLSGCLIYVDDEEWTPPTVGTTTDHGAPRADLGPEWTEPVEAYRFRATERGFEYRAPGAERWAPFEILGVNVSLALPGTRPGEFTATEEQIYGWLEESATLGLNTLRIYTVQSPEFYRALRRFNLAHPWAPFFLLQGIWIKEPGEEEGEALDYGSASSIDWVRDEIEKVVDVTYGARTIPAPTPERGGYGRAYGRYVADVSPWLIGWLLGREMEPYTIEETHQRHGAWASFSGAHVEISGGNPTEVLIAGYLDYLLSYQEDFYGELHSFAFSNWPTLDPLYHWTEPPLPISSEEAFTVDVEKFRLGERAAEVGHFASYHAYPYYPDFILHQPEYQIEDDEGPNSYLGYLLELRSYHRARPLLISEIGLPSSQGSAHLAESGLHHGGLSERQTGAGLARILRTLKSADIDGYCLFALLDEWFKRAWVVDRLELPAEHRHRWYNPMSPEQNFGLIALAPGPSPSEGGHLIDGLEGEGEWPEAQLTAARAAEVTPPGTIRDLTVHHDEGYLHIKLRHVPFEGSSPEEGWSRRDYWFLFDTIDPRRGSRCLDPRCFVSSARGIEFRVAIESPDRALFFVDRPYDLFGLWHRRRAPWQAWRSVENWEGIFHLHRTLTNVEYLYEEERLGEEQVQETGWLPTGREEQVPRSNFFAAPELGVMELRIPWTLLAVTDPTERRVVDDRGAGTRDPATSITEEIAVGVLHLAELDEGLPFGSIAADAIVSPGAALMRSEGERTAQTLQVLEGLPALEPRDSAPRGWSLNAGLLRYRWEPWEQPRWHIRQKLLWGTLQEAIRENATRE